jgi:WD40 repeat protein
MLDATPSRNPPVVPDHELLRCIGSGSYGEVWLARNVMGTYRAIKVVYRQTFDHDRPYEREFTGMQKFEPVSRTHDGLVDILQIGRNETAGYYYYVMELGDDVLSGQAIDPDRYEPRTLASDLTRTTRLSFQECLEIGLSLTDALDHLHSHGLVHRDIKPSNLIFVHGIPKIADIGLVAELGAPQSFVGTQGFIPPEGPGSPQADIYSLGKVLYEMSSGKDRQTYPELPTQLENFRDQAEYLELNEVIIRACAANLKQRYTTAAEMHADLLLLQAGKSVKRLRLLERRLSLVLRLGAVGLALGLVGLGAYYQTWRAERRETRRLIEAYVAHANRSIEAGDLIGSLPWLAEALRECGHAGVDETPHRVRIAAVLEKCPRIVGLWLQPTAVNYAAFSPDGNRVITALKDGRATVWDPRTSTVQLELVGHRGEVETATFSPDGRRILTASLDGTAQLWDSASGEPLGPPLQQPPGLYSAHFHPSADLLITAGGDDRQGAVCLWERQHDRWRCQVLVTNTAAYRSAEFSRDGSAIAIACENGTAVLWEHHDSWQPVHTNTHGAGMWVYRHVFSPDDRQLASGSFDRNVLIWDRQRRAPALPSLGHPGVVHDLEFSPDGRHLLVACLDFTVRLWNLRAGSPVTVLRHSGNVTSASYSPEGRYIVTAGVDGVTRVWDLAPLGWRPPPDHRAFSENGRVAVVVREDRLEFSFPFDSEPARTIQPTLWPLAGLILNHAGSHLVTFAPAGTNSPGHPWLAQAWNVHDARPAAPPYPSDDELRKALLSHDGSLLLTCSGTNAWIRDASDGRLRLGPLLHRLEVKAGGFSPDGRRFATRAGNLVCLWALPAGTLIDQLEHPTSVSHTEFSPDSRLLITCCSEYGIEAQSAQLWNAETGEPIGPPRRHRDGVLSASFSPDGRRYVTASEDTTAAIWSLDGERPEVVLDHADEVYHAAFNPGGDWVLTACRDGTLRVWQVAGGVLLTPPLPVMPPNVTWQASFLADGRSVLARRITGQNALVQLVPTTNTTAIITLTAQLLSGYEETPGGSLFPLSTNRLWNTWTNVSPSDPLARLASTREMRAWHEREALTCEQAGLTFAAEYHRRRQNALNPLESTNRMLKR